MKHINSLVLLVGLLCFWGCSDKEMEFPQEHETALKVYVESEDATRQGFDQNGKFYWSATDVLGVTTSTNLQYFSGLHLSAGAGTPKATFTGKITGELNGYAVCPHNDKHYFEGSTLHYLLPSTYNYTQIDDDFFSPTPGSGNSFNAPMWSKIEAKSITMHHLGGVLCIKVDELPIGENLKLIVSSMQKMNGYFTANLTESTPSLVTEESTKDEDTKITFTFKNNKEKQSGVFYAPVPVGTYKNTRIKLFNNEKEVSNTSIGNVILRRSKLKMINLKQSDISGGDSGNTDNQQTAANADLLFGSQQDLQELTLNLKSDWHVEIEGQSPASRAGVNDWIEISPISGHAGNVSISTKTLANTTKESRKGRIKIVSDEDDINLDVLQVSNEAMVVAKPKYKFGPTGGSLEVDVDDLEDHFTIETTVGWIKNKTLPEDDDRRLFEVEANTGASPRYGKVIFTSGKGKAQQIIEFEQAGNDGQVDPGTNPGGGILIVSSQSKTFDSNRHEFDIEVLSKVPFQVETPSLPWIHHIETIGQRIHFVLDANATYDARNALLRIYNVQNNQMAMLSVNQLQKDAIVLAYPMYQFSQLGGDLNFEVGHNVDYDITIDVDWITNLTKSSRALVNNPLSFKVLENKTNDNREGHITFTSKDKTITQSVLVKQAQVDAMIIDQTEFSFDDKNNEFTIKVTSNVEFDIVNNLSWVHQDLTRAMTDHILHFTVDQNSDYSERTGELFVRSTDMKQKVAIKIQQAQHDAIVLPRSLYTIDYKGGDLVIATEHNVKYEVTADAPWIHYEKPASTSRALTHKDITVNIEQNPDANQTREGHVILTSTSGTKAEVTIRQLPESMQHEVNVRAKLTDFYRAIDGDNWWNHTNWCTDAPLNDWYGVTFENNLLTLDLSKNNVIGNVDLSHFDELQTLILNEDNITSLNVSSCAMLNSLQCNKSFITDLNPTNCPNLVSISCQENKLSTIPLTGLGELKDLDCNKNYITTLNLLPVQKLNSLNISYNNKLTELSVNHLKQLKVFRMESTGLETIDCSDMPLLEQLHGYSNHSLYHIKLNNCVALQYLDIHYCPKLRGLNITDCKVLNRLYSNDYNDNYNNYLKYIVVWDGFIETEHTNFDKAVGTKYIKIGQTVGEALNITPSFKNSLIRQCDFNMDDEISVKEASLVTELNCDESNISGDVDLTKFNNLEELSIFNNKVTGINLSTCTKLTELNCSNNMIKTLNLSNSSDLLNLYCQENALSTLTITNCTKLENLYCNQNQLQSLDLTPCSQLKKFNCEHNSIAMLNLTNCKNLKTFNSNYNKLSSLDFSPCTEITDIYCDENLVETINLTNCTKLENLNCRTNKLASLNLEMCCMLKSLDCCWNNLTVLDISNNKKLTSVSAYGGYLNVINVWKGFNKNSLNYFGTNESTQIIEK